MSRHYSLTSGGRHKNSRGRAVFVALVFVFVGITSAVQRQQTPVPKSAQAAPVSTVVSVPVERPVVTPVQQPVLNLQPILSEWERTHKDQQWGIAVKSLTGKQFEGSINPDKQFNSASLYKLFLVKPLFERYDITEQATKSLPVGDNMSRSMSACVDLMLRVSDNPCGEAVGNALGWSRVTKQLQSAGYKHTDFSRAGNTITTAGDTARFLQQLPQILPRQDDKAFVMQSLAGQKLKQGIPKGCSSCKTYSKTGSIAGVTHDAAIIEYNGGSYVLAIMSAGGSFKQIAELTAKIQSAVDSSL